MTETPTPISPLRPGLCLGPNRILRWLGTSDIGTSYEVTFGTTTHAYRLLVVSPELGIGVGPLEAVVKRFVPVSHPCLAKTYAWGCDEGYCWVRSEFSTGVPLGDFALPAADKARPWPRGEMVAHVGRLLELCRGAVPQPALWPIVGDLLEGLACLHRAGLVAGPFSLESVLFQKGRHGKGVVAKWSGYGLQALHDPVAAERATLRDDVQSAGKLIRALLCGEAGAMPVMAWPEWDAFLSHAMDTEDGFADAEAMYGAFAELLERKGLSRELREQQSEVPPERADESKAEGTQVKARAHERRKRVGVRRSHHDTESAGTHSAQMSPVFRVFLMMGILCLLGFGAYWVISRPDRLRREGLTGASRREGQTEQTPETVAAKVDYWSLGSAELEELSKNGDDPATMLRAFRVAEGDVENPPDVARGTELASNVVERLQQRIDEQLADGDTLYWLAHAKLTGLGTPRDEANGRALLELAIEKHNHFRSMALLADYLAFAREERSAEDDRLALDLWQKAVNAQQALTPHAAGCIDKAVAFVLAGRGLPPGDATVLTQWVESVARLRHSGAMIALGLLTLEGRILALDEPRAMNWFRSAAMTGNAEGMRRMAWMFERGIGTPQSDKSAALWYRRAALGGDADAMEQLAILMAAGRGDETPDAAAEEEFRRKAVAARAAAKARVEKQNSWWMPGNAAQRGTTPDAAAVAPSPSAVPKVPEEDHPASPEESVPPVTPELMHPGEGPLVPMG